MILRPSNAYKWAVCGGSLKLEELYPEPDSNESRQGTAAHWFCTEALDGRIHAVGTLAPNGYPIDDEMVEAGFVWLEDVWAELGRASGRETFRVEHKLTMHGLIHPLCEGTPDAYMVDGTRRRIILWDYKFGHRFVEPFCNPQCVSYLAGVMEAFEFSFEDLDGWEIEVRIAQPRNYKLGGPIRVWRVQLPMLAAQISHMHDRAEFVVSKGGDTQTLTGGHCRDCSGRHACPALQMSASLCIDYASGASPVDLPTPALALELKLLHAAQDRLKARTTALEEVLLAKIRAGETVPGWGIEHGQAREQWLLEPEAVFAYGDALGVDLRKPAAPLTPAQARKAGAATAGMSYHPSGKAELTIIDANAVAKVFAG